MGLMTPLRTRKGCLSVSVHPATNTVSWVQGLKQSLLAAVANAAGTLTGSYSLIPNLQLAQLRLRRPIPLVFIAPCSGVARQGRETAAPMLLG